MDQERFTKCMPDYEQLVSRIYEAAATPDLWSQVLSELSRDVHASAGFLVTWRTDHWLGMCCSSEPVESQLSKYMHSDAPARSITTPRLLSANIPGFISNQELFTEEEYDSDSMMTEWARPSGFYHGAATAVQMPNGDVVVMQFMKCRGQAAFTRNALDRLDAYRPHLARAALMATRWRLERLRAATEALAIVGLPAAILDLKGQVIMTNSQIEAMTTHIVWQSRNRFAFSDKAATDQLQRAIAELGNPSMPSIRSFPVRGNRNKDPIIVHLIPTPGRSRDIFEGGLGILVVTPVTGPTPPNIALIQGLFDLTPAEAKVARGIVEGRTINEMAAQYGTVRETVRSQVKSVLTKTGTRRQVEVASLLSGLPKIHSA